MPCKNTTPISNADNRRMTFGHEWQEATEKVQEIRDFLDSLYGLTGDNRPDYIAELQNINEHLRQAERIAMHMTGQAECTLSNPEACANHPDYFIPENTLRKAFFTRKPSNIAECEQCISRAKRRGAFESEQVDYQILLHRTLEEKEWVDLTEGFLVDRPWLDALNREVEVLDNPSPEVFYCMQINVQGRPGRLLIATSGYTYARYVALLD